MSENYVSGRPSDIYRYWVKQGQLTPDSHQLRLLPTLDRFYGSVLQDWRADRSSVRWWRKLRGTQRQLTGIEGDHQLKFGLYLCGGVGRGKSRMMRMVQHSLPVGSTLGFHFHELMSYIHQTLNELIDHRNPLITVAERIADRCRVLMIDEFVVVNITDAMLMAGLLRALTECGVRLVLTSNFLPDQLYRDGLQRQRFVPAIRWLETHTIVMNFGSGLDYRRGKLANHPIYIQGEDSANSCYLVELYGKMTGKSPRAKQLMLVGRGVPAVAVSADLAWFDFRILCGAGRSRDDYRQLALIYSMLFIDRLYAMDESDNELARRFIHLIDILYEYRVKIVVAARVALDQLYQGQRLAGEFNRTRSRLIEMCTEHWLGLTHFHTTDA